MKKNNINILILVFSTGLFLSACNEVANEPSINAKNNVSSDPQNLSGDYSATYDVPTGIPAKALQFMREEEKLARDVYLSLYYKYSLRVFKNISSSEQTHTDAVKILLVRYQIEDPVNSDVSGQFKNLDLQKLYDDLIVRGNISDIEALKVGATIEEIDILDLEKHISELTNNPDILKIYTSLKNASINHLNSFVGNLAARGIVYSPVYLTFDEYEKIIN
jgi:hypothetical protein